MMAMSPRTCPLGSLNLRLSLHKIEILLACVSKAALLVDWVNPQNELRTAPGTWEMEEQCLPASWEWSARLGPTESCVPAASSLHGGACSKTFTKPYSQRICPVAVFTGHRPPDGCPGGAVCPAFPAPHPACRLSVPPLLLVAPVQKGQPGMSRHGPARLSQIIQEGHRHREGWGRPGSRGAPQVPHMGPQTPTLPPSVYPAVALAPHPMPSLQGRPEMGPAGVDRK